MWLLQKPFNIESKKKKLTEYIKTNTQQKHSDYLTKHIDLICLYTSHFSQCV